MKIHYERAHIKIISDVYEPSEDSFLLAKVALDEIKGAEKILEVGCGSGIISSVIKANTKANIIGIDISPHAVKCTKENEVEVIRGDLLSCIKGKFDIIIFNPPYLPTAEEERSNDWISVAIDGGYDGRRVIYRFLKDSMNRLTENGRILMLLSSLTGLEEVKSMMASAGYAVEYRVQERLMFEHLTVIAARKQSAAGR